MSIFRKLLLAIVSMLLTAMLLAIPFPPAPAAAAIQVSAAVKNALDKLLAASTATTQASIRTAYNEFVRLQGEDAEWDSKLKTLQQQNTAAEQQVRKQISAIDSAKINALKQQAEQARARYKTLFEQYAFINRQLATARALKNKTSTALLRNQAELMKPAVQLARSDIRGKDTLLKSARQAATQRKNKIKADLAETAPLKTTRKNLKQSITDQKKKLAAEWKQASAAIRQANSAVTLRSLASAAAASSQLVELKKSAHATESKIAAVIERARKQL
ncbi:hypothetical protein [Paenibacillus sp. GCM10027626]|uniref:hypothetical protein n=1 Tax=Paenibacillus sp. GCM10027626 TaxID=3273411 RepID=UPI003636E7CC